MFLTLSSQISNSRKIYWVYAVFIIVEFQIHQTVKEQKIYKYIGLDHINIMWKPLSEQFYIINGFADDAHLYRHGKKIVRLHKSENNFTGNTFWDLTGRNHTHCKWFVAIGRGDNVVGTCMVSPLENKDNYQELSCFVSKSENSDIDRDLVKCAKNYSKGTSLVCRIPENDNAEKARLENLGALEAKVAVVPGKISMVFSPNMRISSLKYKG
jgi:hypothetical protein